MATIAQSYILNGQTTFFFPFAVRFKAHIDLEIEGAGTVDPSDYTVLGAGPAATGVEVSYPDAPADGSLLTIQRVVPIQRVAGDFPDDERITAAKLNDEFNNIYQILEQQA